MAAAKPKLEGRRKAWARRRDNPDTREELLSAAAVAFARDGYEQTSLVSLARTVGITAPSVYNHFPSKGALLFAYIDAYTQRVMQACITAVTVAGSDPCARLRALVIAHIIEDCRQSEGAALASTFYRRGTGVTRVLDDEQNEILTARQRAVNDLLREIILDGISARIFAVDDVKVATLSIIGSVSYAVHWIEPSGQHTVTQAADLIADLALASLSSAVRS